MKITITTEKRLRKDYAQANADAAVFAAHTDADLLRAAVNAADLAHPETLVPLFADAEAYVAQDDETGAVTVFRVSLYTASTVTGKLCVIGYLTDKDLHLLGEKISLTDYRKSGSRAFNIPR